MDKYRYRAGNVLYPKKVSQTWHLWFKLTSKILCHIQMPILRFKTMQLALVRFYEHFLIGTMQDCSIQRVVAVVVIFYIHVQCIAYNDSPCCLENGKKSTDSIAPPRWFMNEAVTVAVLLLNIDILSISPSKGLPIHMAIHRITVALLPSVNDRSCKNQVGGLRSPQLSKLYK